MKFLALMLALGALLFAAILTPPPARAALSFEDPQLCVNGKLLMIEPTTAGIEVWVRVGPDLTVDFDVLNCAGDVTLPVVAASHVTHDGKKNWLEVSVQTEKDTDIKVHWDGDTTVKKSGKDAWAYFKTKIK